MKAQETTFVTKEPQIFGNLLGDFENVNFSVRTDKATLDNFGYFSLQQMVTLTSSYKKSFSSQIETGNVFRCVTSVILSLDIVHLITSNTYLIISEVGNN